MVKNKSVLTEKVKDHLLLNCPSVLNTDTLKNILNNKIINGHIIRIVWIYIR